ncbi:hypothetical protein [Bacteroides sp.]|uniref:hypothetical protein n=1 Tax=Bacteroides sp. TaxID=29523 RepID=UPI002614E9CD|nr:hypothetical protein [Bacteroides sp.]MDD3036513.1 hypothetical protein [Bacteroides sp.]
MKNIIYIICAIGIFSFTFLSCDKPEELTPKVESVTDDYLLPKGNILTSQEREEIQARWDEYNTAIDQ